MKLLTKLLVDACMVCASTLTTNAQEEEPKSQMFMIHVDHVIAQNRCNMKKPIKGLMPLAPSIN